MRCNYFERCGGCEYDKSTYEEELENKRQYINNVFRKEEFNIEVIRNDNPFGYRNKAHFVMHLYKGKISGGFYEEKTKRVLPIKDCCLHLKEINRIGASLLELLNKHKILPASEKRGVLKDVIIRYGVATKESMIILVTDSPLFPGRNNLVTDLKKIGVATVVQNIQERDTPITLGDQFKVLSGKGFILDRLGDHTFKISPDSFYQVNAQQTVKLYKKAIEFANLKETDRIIDAYSGIGTIGIIAAKKVKEVIAVEANPKACFDARYNAKLNNVDNISIINRDAVRFMTEFVESPLPVDVLFVDPPRSGCTEEFLKAVIALKIPKVVYISCNPESLYRDYEIIKQEYSIRKIVAVDMFSRTKHVECVCCLELKG